MPPAKLPNFERVLGEAPSTDPGALEVTIIDVPQVLLPLSGLVVPTPLAEEATQEKYETLLTRVPAVRVLKDAMRVAGGGSGGSAYVFQKTVRASAHG